MEDEEDECWDYIEHEELGEVRTRVLYQVCVINDDDFSAMEFSRLRYYPECIDDFLPGLYDNRIMWLDNDTFVLKKKPRLRCRNAARIDIYFSSKKKCIFVYGETSNAVAVSAAKIMCLKPVEVWASISVGAVGDKRPVPTSFITPDFLRDFKENHPKTELRLGRNCLLLTDESKALASHPESLKVSLNCRFIDGGGVFVRTLSERTSYFGDLSLEMLGSYRDFRRVFFAFGNPADPRDIPTFLSAMNMVHLITSTLVFNADQHVRDLLTSPVRHLHYLFDNDFDFSNVGRVEMGPERVTVEFDTRVPTVFQTCFMREMCGRLKYLRLMYFRQHGPSQEQGTEILHAIRMNSSLNELVLWSLDWMESRWAELSDVLTSHNSLQKVGVTSYSQPRVEFEVELRKFMLTNRRKLTVVFHIFGHDTDREQFGKKMNKFQCLVQSEDLATNLSDAIRLPVLSKVVRDWAGDPKDGFWQIANHTGSHMDMLCRLIEDATSGDSTADRTEIEMEEGQPKQKRPRL